MLAWFMRRARALRTWLFVRLRIWRGRWRRGRITVPGLRLLHGLGHRTWSYGLYAPGGLSDEVSAPLIVVLHGCKQRALSFAYAAGWTDFADSAHVRLLCPDQRRLANFHRCWNWFHPLAQSGQGELAVITAMIDDAAGRVRIDERAVAVIGISAGGALSALLAFHKPQRFRAAVAVAAPPLLGHFNVQNPHGVMQRGVALNPCWPWARGARPARRWPSSTAPQTTWCIRAARSSCRRRRSNRFAARARTPPPVWRWLARPTRRSPTS